ncbi:MAG: XdhC family protein [Actinomycetota bacterium]|nr:XdhC family protein [Actinomycetota bacterium]
MSETIDVLKAVSDLKDQGRPMALATIVSVSGSTYRRPGARLLVPDEGASVGNLSGGCLEGEVEDLGRDVMASGESRLTLYDLTADDEVIWGWGLGCNGAIEVFVEPAERAAEIADTLRDAIENERAVAIATVLTCTSTPSSTLSKPSSTLSSPSSTRGVPVGARLLVRPGEDRRGSTGVSALDDELELRARDALASGRTEALSFMVSGYQVRAFIESVLPPPRLLVCGAGHDAIPVVKLASELGWRTVVVDDRSDFLDRARFPGAGELVEAQPGEAAAKAGFDRRCFALVMSHNYLRDRDYLKSFLGSDVAYIGMLGPQARTERLLADLATEGIVASSERLSVIHGPAGLDLGSEGPEEIAVAIVAEVLAVTRAREGGFLRDRSGTMHDHLERAES